MVNSEIYMLQRAKKSMLPKLKRIYEDQNYIYLIFKPHYGDDLL